MMRTILLSCLLAACATAPVKELEVRPGALDATRFLEPTAQRARAAGAGPLDPIAALVVSEGEQIGSFVEVRTDRCVLVLARAGGSVRDVDLFVYSDGGDRLASDEAPEPDAAVIVCPPHPRRVYVAARIMVGTGMLAVGVMPVPPPRSDAVARAVGARGRPGDDTGKLAAWPGLERKVRERRKGLGSSWDDIRRVAMHVDPQAPGAVSVPIEARRCLDVLITPSEQVRSVDATVLNEEGRVVARGRPPGRDRTFVLCSATDETLTILVRPRMSSGLVAVIIGRSPPGAAVELGDGSVIDAVSPIAPLPKALERHAARTARLPAARELGRSQLEVARPSSMPIALGRGCTRIDAVGGEPLGSFTAELWSDQGERLSHARGGEVATLFHCGQAAKARIELAASER
ncbi:MAG TPA: hypothetical protein VFB62_00105, partial [Polyangiaceae bacterium]|nr:hypothetical protein [Polyangiaceae bacterium]